MTHLTWTTSIWSRKEDSGSSCWEWFAIAWTEKKNKITR